ncbi:hypothetical protein Peur_062720 [Populus x canadensis]
MTKINQWWDEIIMPTDEEPLHENHEEDGKITVQESTNAIKDVFKILIRGLSI